MRNAFGDKQFKMEENRPQFPWIDPNQKNIHGDLGDIDPELAQAYFIGLEE